MTHTLEIRALKLNPGVGSDFDRRYRELSLPLLRMWGFDVVRFGASLHDADSYYVLRAFGDLADRERAEDEFYASDAWRNGPRETILGMIESYADTVLQVSTDTIGVLSSAPMPSARILEIRSYKLKPNSGAAFERLFREQAEPMVRAYGMDVIAFGQSEDDADSWYLIRAFDSLEHLMQSEDEFYGSNQWRNGPRKAVLSHIESYHDTVLAMNSEAIDALGRDLAA